MTFETRMRGLCEAIGVDARIQVIGLCGGNCLLVFRCQCPKCRKVVSIATDVSEREFRDMHTSGLELLADEADQKATLGHGTLFCDGTMTCRKSANKCATAEQVGGCLTRAMDDVKDDVAHAERDAVNQSRDRPPLF